MAAKSPNLDPTHAPLLPLLPNQCLLLVDYGLMEVDHSQLWLDNLYVRFTAPRDTGFTRLIRVHGDIVEGEVWITNMTMQGNSGGDWNCRHCSLDVWRNAAVYVEGMCTPNVACTGCVVSLIVCSARLHVVCDAEIAECIILLLLTGY